MEDTPTNWMGKTTIKMVKNKREKRDLSKIMTHHIIQIEMNLEVWAVSHAVLLIMGIKSKETKIVRYFEI